MVTLEERLAEDVGVAVPAWVDRIVATVEVGVPGMVAGDAGADLAVASSTALLEEFVRALGPGDLERGTRAPSAALGFARHLARTEAGLAGLLRSYRLGQELLFDRAAELAGSDTDGLRRVGLLTFRFVDAVVDEVAEAFEREREAFLRGSALRRERLVGRMLAGEQVAVGEVESVLGWRMRGRHVGLVVWSAGGAPDAAHRALPAVFEWIGDGTGLSMPGAAGEWFGWTTPASPLPGAAPPGLLDRLSAAGVRVAVGQPAPGVEGFVATRRQADAARRVARHLPTRTVVLHEEVALLHLLLADQAAATAFVSAELGALADPSHGALRATVRTYLELNADTTATAGALGLHRNTVMRRIERAGSVLGRPVGARARETHAALLIHETAAPTSGWAAVPADPRPDIRPHDLPRVRRVRAEDRGHPHDPRARAAPRLSAGSPRSAYRVESSRYAGGSPHPQWSSAREASTRLHTVMIRRAPGAASRPTRPAGCPPPRAGTPHP